MIRLSLRPRAIAGLRAATGKDRQRINGALNILGTGSFPLHTEKLGGTLHGYRTRVGRWRILFALRDGGADIADIFLKRERGDYRRRTRS